MAMSGIIEINNIQSGRCSYLTEDRKSHQIVIDVKVCV